MNGRLYRNVGPPAADYGWQVRGLIAAAVIFISFMSVMQALSHGPADWIRQGGYKNAIGEACCGERDCSAIPASNIRINAYGYHIVSLNETVPFAEATPSPDGFYWRCYWGGKRKCFFAPPPNT